MIRNSPQVDDMTENVASALTSCDLEPIHIPGSIQPYGVMLIADMSGEIVGYAGNATSPIGQQLSVLIGMDVGAITVKLPVVGVKPLGKLSFDGQVWDGLAYRSGDHLVLELLSAGDDDNLDTAFLSNLEALGTALEQTVSLSDLSQQASRIFQDLTGYSRVMIYQFLDDNAGVVLGESISDASSSFLNHHFPATDIPRQARALYVRNKVRVIADVNYTPAPVISASSALQTIDMSDSTLRSVSPVHIQYLKNMGVAASASMSIVNDGILWGLVACHHNEPRALSLTVRLACQAVATSLARQIKAREDSALYRERIRLRAQEDVVLSKLGADDDLVQFFKRSGLDLASLLEADGFAAVQLDKVFSSGTCPDENGIRAIAEFVRRPAAIKPFVTSALREVFAEGAQYSSAASGVLAVTMSTEVPSILMWFRSEKLQTVEWAGNPHKNVPHDPAQILSPRVSFEAWSESVRGTSRAWTIAETESGQRIVRLMLEARNNRRMRQLNKELSATLKQNENLMQQKDYLLKEVNHRVQNSLSLVSAFLRMQARSAPAEVRSHLEQAEQRLIAVGLVHRRLYQDDSVEIIDLSRYLTELLNELETTLDGQWKKLMVVDFAPILINTDRAVSLGLIVNELITNAVKYAYHGSPGQLQIVLEQHRNTFRLIVADRGRGLDGNTEGTGFGSRMLTALLQRLGGTIAYNDNKPGLRVVVTATIESSEEPASH